MSERLALQQAGPEQESSRGRPRQTLQIRVQVRSGRISRNKTNNALNYAYPFYQHAELRCLCVEGTALLPVNQLCGSALLAECPALAVMGWRVRHSSF
jgi:hypothetical protein